MKGLCFIDYCYYETQNDVQESRQPKKYDVAVHDIGLY